MADIYFKGNRADLRRILGGLPGILAGRAPDPLGIALGLKLRVGVAVLSFIQDWFDTKADGGTDPGGVKWAPLSKAYLAYQRRFGKNEQKDLATGAGLNPKLNKFAPGGKKGLLTEMELKSWRGIYSTTLARLRFAGVPEARAKNIAAGKAWAIMKDRGAKTKLEVFGNRKVQILRDTGILRNSLSPGIEDQPSGANEQIFDVTKPGEVIVGTNVPYARAHHEGRGNVPKRPLWPDPEDWPEAAWGQVARVAAEGVIRAVGILLSGNRGAA